MIRLSVSYTIIFFFDSFSSSYTLYTLRRRPLSLRSFAAPITGMFCRNHEVFGMKPLERPCTPTPEPPICLNRNKFIPNKDTCVCGTTMCNKFSGFLCDAEESQCTKSECNAQAIEAMSAYSDTCAKFNPRCECSLCLDNHYGEECAQCPASPEIGWVVDISTMCFGLYVVTGLLYYTFRPSNKHFKNSAVIARKQMTQLTKITMMGSSMISVLIGQMQIVSIVVGIVSWSPDLPPWLVNTFKVLGDIFSIDFVGIFSSFECAAQTTPLERWYITLCMPFGLLVLFQLWYLMCVVWFKYLKRSGIFKLRLKALDITYEIIVEAAVNVLLIGIYKTVAHACFQIFDCTPFTSDSGDALVSKLILDTNIVCPHAYFMGYTNEDPGTCVDFLYLFSLSCTTFPLPYFHPSTRKPRNLHL